LGRLPSPSLGATSKLDDEVAWTHFIYVRVEEDEPLTRIVSYNNNVDTILFEIKLVKRDIPVFNIEAI
jgi:hypothetical protein